jgi:DNA polymerase-3 subunit epsilon
MRELLFDSSFVAIDIETTGFDVRYAEIIEVAAVRVEGGMITDSFSSLVNPGFFIPDRVRELTGITNTMLVGKPKIDKVLPQFLDFIGDDVVVAHNVEQDMRFLNRYSREVLKRKLRLSHLCTVRISRRLIPGLSSYKLYNLADYFGIEFQRKHRALSDALITAQVFLELLKLLWNHYGIGDYLGIKHLSRT